MSRKKLFTLCLLLALAAQTALAQTADSKQQEEELKKEASAFLKETAADVGSLQTLENRISFAAEIAGLMWFEDEGEARAMFQRVMVDFRQLLMQIDAQYTALDAEKSDDSSDMERAAALRKLTRKLGKVISVRQQIALSVSEHDPDMAYEFFNSTAQAVANPLLRAQFAERDPYFEIQLIYAVADKDADKALAAGRARLAKGMSFELIQLLKKIYDKNPDKGITFGEDIVSKIKSDNGKASDFYLFSELLRAGEDNAASVKDKPGKKRMLSEQSMRDIADLLAQEILKNDILVNADITGYLQQIEKYSPGRTAQIRQKFKLNNASRNDVKTVVGETEAPLIETRSETTSVKSEMEFFNNAQNLSKQLSTEEREKLLKDSRATIAKIKDRDQKIIALSFLAAQIALSGDRETAAEIMNEARAMVNLQPKNYKDFYGIWMLATGYAIADADKAFPLLEDAISRLNETISAFVKVAEFIDAEEEMIEGGEIQVGVFGGGMVREMLGGVGGMATPTLRGLAANDFARTKALTNRFDRAEVRILAKMLVLRSILGDKKTVKSE